MQLNQRSLFVARGHNLSTSRASKLCMMAEDILQEIPGRAAHIDDIARIAIEKNANLGLDLDDLKSKLSSALAAEVKKKQGAVIARVIYKKAGKAVNKKGWYRLKPVTGTRTIIVPPPQPDGMYFGKFGEYAVISELLYWGFNVSPMIVDQGIDLVAERASKYFYIQVKASCESESTWKFTIKRASFDANHSGLMHYIFVLRSRSEISNIFVVVPSTHIDTLIKSHSIKGDSASLSIKISSAEKGKSWRLNNTECAMFVNAFTQLV